MADAENAAKGGAQGTRLPSDARLLVTGGAGFIGSAFVRDVLGRRDGARITVLDILTYAGNRANLAAVTAKQVQAMAARVAQPDRLNVVAVGLLENGEDRRLTDLVKGWPGFKG